MSEDTYNSVLLSTFYSGNKRYRLYFHRNRIVWDNEKPPYAQRTLPIEDVLSVQYNFADVHLSQRHRYDPCVFTLHYARRKQKSSWQYECLTLRHTDVLQVSSWVKTLRNHLQKFTFRPKRLLLFVNPYGGKKKALHIFDKFGKPLFDIAGVDVSVVVSQRQNQIRDILITHNLDTFDAVACVGGDGTVSEMFNGLVIRECNTLGVDPHDADGPLPKPSLPVGIIPGGSTDTIAYCLYGTTDVTTAVLHIIFGDSVGLDLVSVHDENRLLRIYASVLSYGYLGDIAYNSEHLRWMGPLRYEYCGFKKILGNKAYRGELVFSTDQCLVQNKNKCRQKCPDCLSESERITEHSVKDANPLIWKTIEGDFFMVSGANVSCACERSPSGIAPYCHLGDGYLHLVIIRHTSIINILRILWRFGKSSYNIDNLSFVETYRAKQFSFKAVGIQSRWNCDGEIQHQTDIKAKVHPQLLKVFSRGGAVSIQNDNVGCTFCTS